MCIRTFLNLLLLVGCIPRVQSSNSSVVEMLSIAEVSPKIAGTTCTSRTLSGIVLDSATNEDASHDIPHCPEGYFCDLWGNENKTDTETVVGLCKACPGNADNCLSSSILFESTPSPESFAFSLGKAVEEECQDQCGVQKNSCSSTEDCPRGLFCNFEGGENGGFCEQCPVHLFYCKEGMNLTSQGLVSCEASCSILCTPKGVLEIITPVTAATSDMATPSSVFIQDVNVMDGSPQLSATGPVVDCGLGLVDCEGVEGAVCFIERGLIPFVTKTRSCFNGGGVAAVIYNVEAQCENILGTFFGEETLIPTLALTHLDGKAIVDQAKSMLPGELIASVEVGGHDTIPKFCTLGCYAENLCEGTDLNCNFDNGDFGDCKVKESEAYCNNGANFLADYLPCTAEREFCDFSSGGVGFCRTCPEVDGGCFFSNLNSDAVKECNAVCTDGTSEKLDSAPCKFCPKGDFVIGDIGDAFKSTTENENTTTPCEFCASSSTAQCSGVNRWNMTYPERT